MQVLKVVLGLFLFVGSILVISTLKRWSSRDREDGAAGGGEGMAGDDGTSNGPDQKGWWNDPHHFDNPSSHSGDGHGGGHGDGSGHGGGGHH